MRPDWSPDSRNRSEEHTSELQSRQYLVCRLLLEKKKKNKKRIKALYKMTRSTRHALSWVVPHCRPLPLLQCHVRLPCGFLFVFFFFFFFNDPATTEISPLSLHDALPISLNTLRPDTSDRTPSPAPISRIKPSCVTPGMCRMDVPSATRRNWPVLARAARINVFGLI